MQLTTRDIIERAHELADLVNSEFANNYRENIKLLNETYQSVYQKLINRGDKSFLKAITSPRIDNLADFPDGAIAIILPRDFYQLYAVQHGKGRYPIPRRSKNQDPKALAYDLINDELVIYDGARLANLTIEYYPQPCTLYLNRPEEPIEIIPPHGNASDLRDVRFNHSLLAVGAGDPAELYAIIIQDLANPEKNRTRNVSITSQDFKLFIESPDFFSLIQGSRISFCSFEQLKTPITYNNAIRLVGTTEPGALQGTWFYDYEQEGDEAVGALWQFVPGYQQPVKVRDNIRLPYSFASSSSVGFITPDLGILVPCDQSVPGVEATKWLCYYKDNEVIPLYPIVGELGNIFYQLDNQLFYADATGLKINSENCLFPGKQIIAVNNLSFDSGRGLILRDAYGDYYNASPFPDSILNFPQSFYYTYLAYSLAVAYAIKQGKEAGGLISQLESQEATFYDTIERDDNAPIRIANVYRR